MIVIREAQPADAGQIAPLINLIFDEMQLEELEDVPEPDLEKVITMAYRTRSYLASDATTVVAEANGQVVGVAFGYPGENEARVDEVLRRLSNKSAAFKQPFEAESETDGDEWYLDSIAVSPDFQGHGVGSQLLKALPAYAQRDGESVMGLIVDFENPGAMKLYERAGFEVVGRRQVGDHQYYHMQRGVRVWSKAF
ncbi:GNAT family N-acetyltransferase [Secundilactobacillus paracollinoides]|uniref:GNAT family acetyltransferase n=1 Tax=Secundilactobacillus paracollinoides TaxID=240427 RepID=A0A1B2IZ76_9LACO|nr:GNAT family N-acetyltransferase [Secundilactobacillus paracollinoides]ANZ61427.1 GNAT family acetyltransferase [Secundilactobacillus paracollinoides]ANZ67347.1 GNAT family acetyltransferase [Secundilactobacillus paracollinoides]